MILTKGLLAFILPVFTILLISIPRHQSGSGRELFVKHCLVCHQADGSGVPGMFPPLRKEKLAGPGEDLIGIILFGQKGPVEIDGQVYTQSMPAADYLTDPQVADILTYMRFTWGNGAPAITPEKVAEVRKKGKGNGIPAK